MFPVVSGSRKLLTKCHSQTWACLCTTSSSTPGGHTLNYYLNHAELTLEVFFKLSPSSGLGGLIPMCTSTMSRQFSLYMIPVTGCPSSGRSRIMATTCMVTVTSPHGRWKLWVSRHHRSTMAVHKGPSIGGRPATTWTAMSRNPALCRYDA